LFDDTFWGGTQLGLPAKLEIRRKNLCDFSGLRLLCMLGAGGGGWEGRGGGIQPDRATCMFAAEVLIIKNLVCQLEKSGSEGT